MEIKHGIISYTNQEGKQKFLFEIKNDGNKDFDFIFNRQEQMNGIRFTMQIKLKHEVKLDSLHLEIPFEFSSDNKLFLNGYQSWSVSKEAAINEKEKPFPFFLKPLIERYKIKYFGDYTFHKYTGKKGNLHSYSYTYIRDEENQIDFAGSLSERSGFTLFRYDTSKNSLQIHKDCKGLVLKKDYIAFDLYFTKSAETTAFENYFQLMQVKKSALPQTIGWTSWYNYYNTITEEIILTNLKNFTDKKIKLDIFQIDDGYQKNIGDWLTPNDRFPNGMKKIAAEIKKAGYKPGYWIAPFICMDNSDLFKNHPDWIVRDEKGEMQLAGFSDVWKGYFYALDIYHTEVQDYLKKVFQTIIQDWGFEFVKLDFLYAAAILPREDKTRGEIICDAIDFLKTVTGKVQTLGCGVPLAPAFGNFDYCRIGCDVKTAWEDMQLKKINYFERVSTAMSVADTIARRNLNQLAFINDPDVFLLRNENIHLTDTEKDSLYLINNLFGSLCFTSDNIANYNRDTMEKYLSHIPLKSKKIESVKTKGNFHKIQFSIGDISYFVYSNLTESLVTTQLEEGLYYLYGNFATEENPLGLMPHESVILVKIGNKDFEIVGSTGHLFPGSEIKNFIVTENEITIELEESFVNEDEIFIKIPDGLEGCKVNGTFVKAEKFKDYNILRLEIPAKIELPEEENEEESEE